MLASLGPRLMPGLFVLLWSTGFIGAKLGLPSAPPLTFLSLRYGLATMLLVGLAWLSGAPWPRRAELPHLAVAGLLLQTIYLGGVFVGIHLGVEAGVSALIVSLQPLLVAALAGSLLGERVGPRQWLGLILGLLGVALVLSGKLSHGPGNLLGAGSCLVSLAAITAGTLYQKRFCGHVDLRTGNAVQFAVSTVATFAAALLVEPLRIAWTVPFLIALLWLVLVLSIGAVSLLYALIRRGAASEVSSLFFLVPPVTALIAWPLFGERLAPLALVGMGIAVLGVLLASRPSRSAA